MDIYSFIEPRTSLITKQKWDIAEYCRSIGQTWTPFEMAVIIGKSRHSRDEKHAAWRELIADYPDMPTIQSYDCPTYDSLHQKLIEAMEYEEQLLALLKRQEPETWYRYVLEVGRRTECYIGTFSTTFEEAWMAAKAKWRACEAGGRSVEKTKITIHKSFKVSLKANTASWLGFAVDFDIEGNPRRFFAPESTVNRYLPEVDYNVSWMFRNSYVYVPNPNGKPTGRLNEDERMLYYKILLMVNALDSSDVYSSEAWDILQILKAGGGKEELDAFWEAFIEGNLNGCREEKTKHDEITAKLID